MVEPITDPQEHGDRLTVFFDGSCPLCSREIAFYKQRRGAERLCWVDVSASPDADVAPGLSRERAMRRFHIRGEDGRLRSGGAAFAALWSALPALSPLGRVFRFAPATALLDVAYRLLLPLRPVLQSLAKPRG